MNFIPTPSCMMNEIFHLPIIYYMLENVINMFIMHSLPSPTQWTYQHCHKIHVNVNEETSYCHLILFYVLGHTESDIIYESIPYWKNLFGWQNNLLQKMINFLSYFNVDLKNEDLRATIVAWCWPRIYIQ